MSQCSLVNVMKARGLGAFLSLTHTYTHTRSHTRTRTYQLHWLLTPRFIQHISNITRKCPRGDTCHGLTFMLCDRDRYGDKHSCNHSPYCDRHRSITHTDSHLYNLPHSLTCAVVRVVRADLLLLRSARLPTLFQIQMMGWVQWTRGNGKLIT